MDRQHFKLYKYHKSFTLKNWKYIGLIESDEFIQALYQRIIVATNCEICNKEFKSSKDRQMEHDHLTGRFRNIVCSSCNCLKSDVKMRSHNTSGYKGICKQNDTSCKQGFHWRFKAYVNGKKKTIKSSVDFYELVAFAEAWKIENNYHT